MLSTLKQREYKGLKAFYSLWLKSEAFVGRQTLRIAEIRTFGSVSVTWSYLFVNTSGIFTARDISFACLQACYVEVVLYGGTARTHPATISNSPAAHCSDPIERR